MSHYHHWIYSNLLILALFTSQAFPCGGCVKAKSFQVSAPKVAGPSGSNILQKGKLMGSNQNKSDGFTENFFNSIGKESQDGNQPTAVPNGDGDEYKVIFQ